MRCRMALVAALLAAAGVTACASTSSTGKDVQAMVVDEKARAAAANVAEATGDSDKGAAVADDAASRETSAPK